METDKSPTTGRDGSRAMQISWPYHLYREQKCVDTIGTVLVPKLGIANAIFTAALCNRAGHYIFAPRFLSFFFFSLA